MKAYRGVHRDNFKLLFNVVFCLGSGFCFFLMTEYFQRGSGDLWSFVEGRNRMVYVNYAIIIIFIAPALLFKRVHFVALILGIPWIVLGVTSAVLLKFRGVPLMWSDVYTVEEGLGILSQYLTKEVIVRGIQGVGGGIGLLTIFFILKFKNYPIPLGKRLSILGFVWIICLGTLGVLTRSITAQRGAWDMAAVYKRDGFIYSLSQSYLSAFRKAPQGYSEQAILEILSDMKERPLEIQEKKPNIIMVQTESFFDPTSLKGTVFNEDPIPHFREYFYKGYHGQLHVPTTGGGTVRTEFEVLSGVSLAYLAPGEIPYNSGILSKEPIETIAYILKDKGYRTTAIHNFEGNFYSRNTIFKHLGFDRLIPMEAMNDLVHYRDFPEDMVLLNYIKRTLGDSLEKDFVFVITAGSHGPYSTTLNRGNEQYVKGNLLPDDLHQIQNYTSLIRRTDEFLGALIEFVYSFKEPTMLVVYSDHYPRLELINEIETKKKFNTPYFIIDNQASLKSNEDNMEAYQLGAKVLDLNHLQGGYMNTFHQLYSKREDYKKKLELLQYDMLFGEKYGGEGIPQYEPSEVKIGLDELKITRVNYEDNKLYIKGSGFTMNSKIFGDKQLIETEFIDEYTLSTINMNFKPEVVEVKLVGRYNIPLLTSNGYSINKLF